MTKLSTRQKSICLQYDAEFFPANESDKLGLAIQTCDASGPWHGLRHSPEEGTSGWFIWKGEYKTDDDFFVPLHAKHLDEYAPEILEYLGLAPGWRFLIDGNYSDVWFDKSLLNHTKIRVSNR